MPRHRPIQCSVRPRFGAGSPASVTLTIADRVAADERRSHEAAATGLYGPEAQAKAQDEHALYGIAYCLEQASKAWIYTDLITGEQRKIPFAQWCLEDHLIRKGHQPSEARHVAEEVATQLPRLAIGRVTEVLHRFESTLAMYEKSDYPRGRAIADSIAEATRNG